MREAALGRGEALEHTMGVSEKFWDDINGLMGTLKDLQDTLQSLEPPALDPQTIREQQDALEALKDDMELCQTDVDTVHDVGQELVGLIGEPDKPEVEKNVDDVDSNWTAAQSAWATRQKALDEALRKATHFQDELIRMLEWLQKKEEQLSGLGPIGDDTDMVNDQLAELAAMKEEVFPRHVDVEFLNQQAGDLTKGASPEQAAFIREPLQDMNQRWHGLIEGMADRKTHLQRALLNLGQFQSALDELLIWLDKTNAALDEAHPVHGDPKVVEIELAKLKVCVLFVSARIISQIITVHIFTHISNSKWFQSNFRTVQVYIYKKLINFSANFTNVFMPLDPVE